MANEITAIARLTVLKDNLQITKTLSDRFDLTGSNYIAGTQDLTETVEQIQVPTEIGAMGWAFFRNLSDTEHLDIGIYIGPGDLDAFCNLEPGEIFFGPLSPYINIGVAVSGYGTTGKVEYVIVER